jgi:hypothetical protein
MERGEKNSGKVYRFFPLVLTTLTIYSTFIYDNYL